MIVRILPHSLRQFDHLKTELTVLQLYSDLSRSHFRRNPASEKSNEKQTKEVAKRRGAAPIFLQRWRRKGVEQFTNTKLGNADASIADGKRQIHLFITAEREFFPVISAFPRHRNNDRPLRPHVSTKRELGKGNSKTLWVNLTAFQRMLSRIFLSWAAPCKCIRSMVPDGRGQAKELLSLKRKCTPMRCLGTLLAISYVMSTSFPPSNEGLRFNWLIKDSSMDSTSKGWAATRKRKKRTAILLSQCSWPTQ